MERSGPSNNPLGSGKIHRAASLASNCVAAAGLFDSAAIRERASAERDPWQFIRAGQVDWAALCSRERTSVILIFRNGNPGAIVELARRADAGFLQGIGANQIGFSRAISVASAGFIRQHHGWYGGPVPPPLTHVGINDAFVGKASIVWYWHRGKWLQLTGSD